MCKKRETNLNNVTMFSFGGPTLLMSIGIRNMVRDTNLLEKGI
jgi:hypothetical protein